MAYICQTRKLKEIELPQKEQSKSFCDWFPVSILGHNIRKNLINNEFNCFNLLPYFPTRLTETPYSRGRFQTSLSEIGGLSCLREFFDA